MTECMNVEVRDALPDLLHGQLGDLDRATMKAHVESCADCRAELALMEHLRANAPLAPSIDVSRIVVALPPPVKSAKQRLAHIAPPRQPTRMSMLWKVAVASALIVGGMLTFSKTRAPVSSGPAVATVAPSPSTAGDIAPPTLAPAPKQVASARPPASVAVKEVVAISTTGLSLTGGLQDLTDAQLEALLKDVDKVEGLPNAEPEPISVSVDGNGGFQ
ncbi:MAG: zf-HC2 domain-containing protein [Gemmatimonadaceae bacterium]